MSEDVKRAKMDLENDEEYSEPWHHTLKFRRDGLKFREEYLVYWHKFKYQERIDGENLMERVNTVNNEMFSQPYFLGYVTEDECDIVLNDLYSLKMAGTFFMRYSTTNFGCPTLYVLVRRSVDYPMNTDRLCLRRHRLKSVNRPFIDGAGENVDELALYPLNRYDSVLFKEKFDAFVRPHIYLAIWCIQQLPRVPKVIASLIGKYLWRERLAWGP